LKKTTLSVVAIAAFLGQASAASEIARDDATRPIIAQMLSNPDAYANKPVTIYGLVIEKESDSVFFLQDVSQRPLKVVGTRGVKAAVGDQITIRGVLSKNRDGLYFTARSLTPTRVLGGGGCC
jgi:hypothetical protein